MRTFGLCYLLPIHQTSFPICPSDGHCSMLHVPGHFVSFFSFEIGVRNTKKIRLRKFRKFTASPLSRFRDIKEVWYKDWKMSLHKPGQVRACFWWITEILDHSTQDLFSEWSFLCGFFQRRKFCHINFVHILDFFSVKFGITVELLELKSRFQ